ncbi:unnamed protein product [Didymodactylos carnosus]|uniref:FLYWCH-type domain-containing protein n=1 Tax=Didymodactylos carnosus TaxID=1234261 RepID=A0A814V1R7_9BILA|nr:unnamed protein product [Didymodactylos carnosus]CAF3943692.1 unnamed protein product [Didymodactylos carnosus]
MSITLSKTSKNAPLLIHNGFSYIIDRRNDEKIFWKCEHARKYACHGRLHTDLSNVFIKTVDDHENHTGNPRSGLIRQYYERLQVESQQNQTNPHNILTQTNIGVPDEVQDNAVSTPTNINLPIIPNKYHRTTRDTIFFRKDTGPGSNRLLIFFTDEQQNIMENATTHGFKQDFETDTGFESLCSNLGDDYQQILDYIEDNYIGRIRGGTRREATFPIQFWNMVARVKNDMHRTNNNVEAWHRKINCAFQSSHPTLWAFLDKLIKEENNLHSDIINAMSGSRPPGRKHETLNKRL